MSLEAKLRRVLAQEKEMPDAVALALIPEFETCRGQANAALRELFLQTLLTRGSDSHLMHWLESSTLFWELRAAAGEDLFGFEVLLRLSAKREFKSRVFSFFALRQIPLPALKAEGDLSYLKLVVNLSFNADIRDRVYAWWCENNSLSSSCPILAARPREREELLLNFSASNKHEIKQAVFDLHLFPSICDQEWGVRLALNLSNDTILMPLLFRELDFAKMLAVDCNTTYMVGANLATRPALKRELFSLLVEKHILAEPSASYWGMLNNIVANELELKRALYVELQGGGGGGKVALQGVLDSKERAAQALLQALAGEEQNALDMVSNQALLQHALASNVPVLWNLSSFDQVCLKLFAWLDETPNAFALLMEHAKQALDVNASRAAMETLKRFGGKPALKPAMLKQLQRDPVFRQVFELALKSKN